MAKDKRKLAIASILHFSFFILHSHAAGAAYVQHVPGDVSDSRQNFPLRVARGETVDLSIDFFDASEPLDISGATVTLHTRTNGMDAAESWQTAGTATNNSALFVLDVDAVLPLASGQWTCVASRDGRTLARLGGPAYVRGTAAGTVAADPVSALSGYATTNYVADAIAEIDVDETDPVWGREKTDYLPVSGGTVTGTLEVLDETLEGAGASVKASDGSNDTYYRWWGIERRQFGDSLSSLTFPGSGRGEIALLGPYGSAYSKSQTDSAIAGAAGASTNYTDSSVATRLSRAEAEDGYTEWKPYGDDPGYTLISATYSSGEWTVVIIQDGYLNPESYTQVGGENDTSLTFNSDLNGIVRTRLRPTPAMEAAWDAKLDDSDLSGYATSADLAAVEASASLVGLLLQGSNVVAEVTNYNSRVHAPELRLLQLSESNEYYQVWAETNGLARTLAGAIEHADGATNALDAVKADRAWSHHTSGLGADAPDGYTWMSTPYTVLAGGLEYEKHVTTGGAIWILKSNGMSADFHAQTNNAAFLDLSSADGTPVFRVEKTDSYLVGVDVTSLSVSGDTLICGVNAIAAEHPLVRVRPSLSTGDWIKEEDGIPASLATVQWSGSSGAWVCEITNNSGGNSFFATMEYLQEGGTKIINSAPLDVSQGILCTDGVHRVRPVYSNGSVTWQVMQ